MADELTLPSLSPLNTTSISPDVLGRIEAIEQLVQALNSELQSLKREIAITSPIVSPRSETPTILYEEFHDFTPPTTPPRDWSSDKETIVSDASIYEELTDPGDWEQLKQELDPNKDTIVSSDLDDPFSLNVNTSFRSVPDPWS
jgi:type IV pilus assembly protein PilB